MAKATGGLLTWGLRNVARRPAGNVPGKIALYVDPHLIGRLRGKLRRGSVVVVGTNGKTTVTNMIADSFEEAGLSVICNRTGANLDSGIASALLQGTESDWGVLECDELWLHVVAPELQPTYVVLLDLFRDQLDRCGEIDRIQDSIVEALASSPDTVLVYNADDPLCQYVAERCGNRTISFGLSESMGLDQNNVADATMCQRCLTMFEYEYRQYGQLGAYSCPGCGFARPELDYRATSIRFSPRLLSFRVVGPAADGGERAIVITTHLVGTYMVYNVLAVCAAALACGCPAEDVQRAVGLFDPKNGRLQQYDIRGRHVLLNLAKNPTGFNQNLRIVETEDDRCGVAFFINDRIVDGFDISWIWDIDFEELASMPNIHVFAGGTRRNDLQVRLKYAGIDAELVDGIDEVFERMDELTQEGIVGANAPVYAIANYSAMPPVHARLDELARAQAGKEPGAQREVARSPEAISEAATEPSSALRRSDERPCESAENDARSATDMANDARSSAGAASDGRTDASPIVIAHVLPDLLNLYGDGGNVRILEQRLRWRGIPVEVRRLEHGDPIDLSDVDLVFLGGGPDREQRLATEQLMSERDGFVDYIEEGGPLLAICGGFQILGRTWLYDDGEAPGLAILGMETRRPGTSADRLIGNFALSSPISEAPVVGFENHAGRTYLDDGVQPFGRVISKCGAGNNDDKGTPSADGVLDGRVLGTYSHGVLLSKNPEVADWVLRNALARHAERTGENLVELAPLDDSVELEANVIMASRLA